MAISDDVYCTDCGSVGIVKLKHRGSMYWTLVLLLFFVVPGLIYWLWIMTHWKRMCAVCGSASIVPADSPGAKALMRARRAE